MLKRLLSREMSTSVAERAKQSLRDEDEGEPVVTEVVEPEPQPAPQPVTQPISSSPQFKRRSSSSMRASDIKDEHGRSAEQLAAEATAEFDIVGLARRVNEEDAYARSQAIDTTPSISLRSQQGGQQAVATMPLPAQSGAVALADATQQAPVVTTPIPPAPPPASLAVDNTVPVAAPAAPTQAPTPAPVQPQAARQPQVQTAAEAQPPARPVQPVNVGLHPPTAKPSGLDIENGHIFHPGVDRGAYDKTQIARNEYWNEIGRTAPNALDYEVSPEAKGAPNWPTVQQRFRLVRTNNSVILATEGLSDPFGAFRGPTDENGYGMELFIEVPGWQAASAEALRQSWAFQALEHTATLCAHAKGISTLIEQNGVMSLDLSPSCAPETWIAADQVEPVGGLLGMPLPPGRDQMRGMPLSKVRVIPLTLIYPEELEDCLVSGPDERKALVNDLLTTGHAHKSDPNRAKLR